MLPKYACFVPHGPCREMDVLCVVASLWWVPYCVGLRSIVVDTGTSIMPNACPGNKKIHIRKMQKQSLQTPIKIKKVKSAQGRLLFLRLGSVSEFFCRYDGTLIVSRHGYACVSGSIAKT